MGQTSAKLSQWSSAAIPRRGLLAGLACAAIALAVGRVAMLRGIDEWMFDGCFGLRGARPTTAKVIIVGIDDDSLAEIKKPLAFISPELAKAVTYLKDRGAAAIGLDLIVPEQLTTLPEMQAGGAGDATKLGAAIAAAGNVVLPKWEVGDRWMLPLTQWQFHALSRSQPAPTDLAFVNSSEDDDNFLRRQQLCPANGEVQPMHMGLALYSVAKQAEVVRTSNGLRIGEETILLDDSEMRINFVGPPGAIKTISFRDVLAAAAGKRALHEDFSGVIVLIGVTAPGGQDYHPTPFSNNFGRFFFGRPGGLMSGTEVIANVVATITDGAFIRPTPWYVTPLCLLIIGPLLGAALARMGLVWGALLVVAHHFAWKGVCLAAFCYGNWRFDFMPMLMLGGLAYAATFVVRWRRLQHMLGVVKSQAIARALEGDPRNLGLRGEERVITALFADIRNFTAFSENHTPQEVVALLNAYFSEIVPLIEKHGGTLNQYMGDGIMVMFGAPQPQEDHAERAVRTAIAIIEQVHASRTVWAEHDCPNLRIGVGIHTGSVVVGTVGSTNRLDYTAIGDTVNAAARVEAENKTFGTEILITAETWRSLPRKVRSSLACPPQPLGATVKGKEHPLELYPITVSQCAPGEKEEPQMNADVRG